MTMMIEKAVRAYIRLYLNPRSRTSSVQLGCWSIEKEVIHDDSLDVSFHLFYHAAQKLSLSEIKKISNQELNRINPGHAEELSALIGSFLDIFYLPLQGMPNPQNFVHHKALAFFQLSANAAGSRKNDAIRLKYIRLLLTNSYFYDRVQKLGFNDGTLFFDKQPLRESFELLLKERYSDIFRHVLDYSLQTVAFLERGMTEDNFQSLLEMVDDAFVWGSHYSCFVSPVSYKFKKAADSLNDMYQYPASPKNQFVNRLYLMNFAYLTKDAEAYFEKYIKDKRVLKRVLADYRSWCGLINR